MSSKIRIKIGSVEVEYEGPEEYLKKELPNLLEAVLKLSKEIGIAETTNNASTFADSNGKVQGTTETLAAKLASKSGGDLLEAAAAQLTLVQGKSPFNRGQLLSEMQGATSYYKKTYSKNLSSYISTAVKDGALMETSKYNYALGAEIKKTLEARLRDS